MLNPSNKSRLTYIQQMAILSLFAIQAHAGSILIHPTKAVRSCKAFFAGNNQGTLPQSGSNLIADKIVRIGALKDFLFNNMLKTSMHRQKKEYQDQVEVLTQEVTLMLQKNPYEGAELLFNLLSSPLNSFRTRSQASSLLRTITLSEKQIDQLEAEIENVYKKSELLTHDPKILGRYNKALEDIENNDPLRQVRPLLGNDIGTNTKLFSSFFYGYIDIILALPTQEFIARMSFISKIQLSIKRNGPVSGDPSYFSAMIRYALGKLASTEDSIKLSSVENLINEYLIRRPEETLELLKSIEYARKQAGLTPANPFKILSIDDLLNSVTMLSEKIKNNPNSSFLKERFAVADITRLLIQNNLITLEGPLSPLVEINNLVDRFVNMNREFGPFEKELTQAYLFTISDAKIKLNNQQSQIIFKLISKLVSDAIQANIDKIQAGQSFNVFDDYISNAILIAKFYAVKNPELFHSIKSDRRLKGSNIAYFAEDYFIQRRHY